MKTFAKLISLLNDPAKVFTYCFYILLASLLIDSSIVKLWGLNRDLIALEETSKDLKASISDIEVKIQKAKSPEHIRREAQDKLDLVESEDIVFTFSDEQ